MKKFLLTLATAFAFVACSGGAAPTPSGDAEKDAKALCEYMVSEIEKCSSISELENLDSKMKPVQEEFNKYEKEHPEYKRKFQKQTMQEAFTIIDAIQKKQQELGGASKK